MRKTVPTAVIVLSFLLVLSSVDAAGRERRLRVRSVKFDGNTAFSDRRLKRAMLTKPSGAFTRRQYHPEVFEDDLKNIVQLYRQEGYLEAEITGFRVDTSAAGNSVDVSISVSEGELTRVEDVSVFGTSLFEDAFLLKKIGIGRGDPFRRLRIQDAAMALLTLYAEHGHIEAEVKPEVRLNAETHLALVDFAILERNRFEIAEIRVNGLEKTKSRVVSRELLFRGGEIIRYSRLLESQRRLYLTGLFESVFIRPVPAGREGSGLKDILIEIRENESIELNMSVGYGTVEKARVRGEIFNNNLAGTARKIGLTAKASFINRGVEASFTEPRILGFSWRMDANLFVDYLDEPGYDITRIGGRFVLGRKIGRRSDVSLAYRYENAEFSRVEATAVPEEIDSRIRSLTLSAVYDSRDNMFNANRGVYLEWSNELAGAFLRGTSTFARSIARLKYFLPVHRFSVLASSLEAGWMDSFGSSEEIPLNERFYAGGPSSLRGFGYQLVGPLDMRGVPLGGRFKLVCNLLELRMPVYKMLGAALFYELGNVWAHASEFRLDDLRGCLGAGLRLNTPIGILRVDGGINLRPRSGENRGKIYFNVGQAF